MDYYKFKFPKTKEISFLGDCHYGSNFCNEQNLVNTVEKLKENKKYSAILMGDLIENASKFSVGSSVYEQKMNPEEQINDIIELLKPIKKQILYSHRGNHEERTFRFAGIEAGNMIAKSLKVPYVKNMALADLRVGKIDYRIFTWHGAGASRTTQGRIKNLEKQAEVFPADAYFMGHVHELYTESLPVRKVVDGEFKDVFRPFTLTGSMLNWDGSYAEMHGMRMVKTGVPLARFDGKQHKIEVDLEW
jgi:predicted phosphodiesterase